MPTSQIKDLIKHIHKVLIKYMTTLIFNKWKLDK